MGRYLGMWHGLQNGCSGYATRVVHAEETAASHNSLLTNSFRQSVSYGAISTMYEALQR